MLTPPPFFRCLATAVAPRASHTLNRTTRYPTVTTVCKGPSYRQSILFQHRFYAATDKSFYWANQARSVYSEADMQSWVAKFPQLNGYVFEDIQKWRNAFDTFDHDKDGYISPADFQKNPNLSLQKVELLKEYDRDNNNLIDFGEFVEAVSALDVLDIRRYFEGFDIVDIQMEFEKFAVQDQGRKIMGLSQLMRLMHYCDCICVTNKDATRLLTEIDSGKDGSIDFEEFRTWLQRVS